MELNSVGFLFIRFWRKNSSSTKGELQLIRKPMERKNNNFFIEKIYK
jgi:hypothetical protein